MQKEIMKTRATIEYAKFGSRATAKMIDSLIIAACNVAFGTSLEGHVPETVKAWLPLSFYLFQIAYNSIFLEKFSATPGKMLFGLQVVTVGGQPIPPLVAFGRSCAELLSALLYIGYLIAASDQEVRTLHDRLCKTRVIRK